MARNNQFALNASVHMRRFFVSLLAGVLLSAPLAWAEQQQASAFLKHAAETNVAEMALAELAQENASNKDVRNYAYHIQQDHELANETLQPIAEKHNVELPEEPNKMHKQQQERLSNLEGKAFDREYLKTMIEGHKKAIQKFEQQAQTAQDRQVKQYAELRVPQLRAHLEQAQILQKYVQSEGRQ